MKLEISAIPPHLWRTTKGSKLDATWKTIRRRILIRDDHTCRFCGLRSQKYMEVHHVDGNHENNDESNLITVCPFCHSVFHVGLTGIQRRGILVVSKLSQLELVRISRVNAILGKGSLYALSILLFKGYVERVGSSKELVQLADRMHLGWKPPENYKLYPIVENFRQFPYFKANPHLFARERKYLYTFQI